MKKSLLILFFTCWALFFAAFRPVMPFAAETAAFPDGTPVTGGRILMGTIGEPSNLIPYMASDSASGEITGLLYVAPLKYDKDLNVVPSRPMRCLRAAGFSASSCATISAGRTVCL